MTHAFSVSRELDAPKAAVWAVLDDFGNLADYDPKNASSQIIAGPETGVGATREAIQHDGGRVVHEIIEYEPPDGYAFEFTTMAGTPAKELVLEFDLEAVDESRTRVTITGEVTPKFGPLGWILAKLVIVPKGKRLLENLLDGLATHVRTGQRVGKGGVPVEASTG